MTINDSRYDQWMKLPCSERNRNYCEAPMDKGVKKMFQECCIKCFFRDEERSYSRLIE